MGRFNKLLAFTFLFLAAYASWYWVQHKKVEKEGSAVFQPSLDSAHSIRIAVTGKPQISLIKRSGRWYMVKPVEDIAEESKVGELVTYAQKIKKERIISPSVRDPSIFGLSPPEAVLSFDTTSASQQLNFGHKTVDEEKIFASTGAGKEVFLVLSEVRENLLDKPFQFREKRLLLMDKDEIEILNVFLDGIEIGFQKNEAGWCQTAGPARQDVPRIADEIVRNLGRSFIFDFIKAKDGALSGYGLNPARLRVKVAGKNGVQMFTFGGEGPQGFVYARAIGRPGVMLVDNPYVWIKKLAAPSDQG